MFEAQDYAGAALEGSRALEVLPDLADIAVMRGRALMVPLLDEISEAEGDTDGFSLPLTAPPEMLPDRVDFKEAWDAFKLALTMDPQNSAAVRELERLNELIKCLPEPTVEVSTVDRPLDRLAKTQSSSAESATVVRGEEVKEDKPSDSAARGDAWEEAEYDVIIVGAGAAGIGCAVSLIHTFGLESSSVLLLERGEAVGETFRRWPEEMRFISPSFNQAGWTKSFDLNSVAYGSSPAFSLHTQHPSGAQYADYLSELVELAGLNVQLHTEVEEIVPVDGVFDLRVRAGAADGEQKKETTLRSRYVVWAAGEFQYPKAQSSSTVAGSELCMHNSQVRSWAGLPGDEFVLIGGYESGVDAAVNLAKAGKRSTVLASTATWNIQSPEPSTELAPYTADRLREVTAAGFSPRPQLLAPLHVKRVERAAAGGFNVIAEWQAADDTPPPSSRRKPFVGDAASGRPDGAVEGSELVVHTAQPPVLCNGFEGSVASTARHLFDLAGEAGDVKGCLAGAPLLTKDDESTKVPGVFLVGPSVVQGKLSFCFIYKFRQRFGVVADAICRGLGRDTEAAVAESREMNMYLDDLTCCEGACGDVC